MRKHKKSDVEVEVKKKGPKFRDTVLVRVDRQLKDEVKKYSKKSHETISQIMDWAVKEYLNSIRPM